MSDHDVVLQMLSSSRIELRKRAVDILAVCSSSCEPVTLFEALLQPEIIEKLLHLLTPENMLLHGTLLTTLTNLTAHPEYCLRTARIISESHGIAKLMRFLEFISSHQPKSEGDLDDSPENSTTKSSYSDNASLSLIFMLLNNITSVDGASVVPSFLQVTSTDRQGQYLEKLLQVLLCLTMEMPSVRWGIQIISNLMCERVGVDTLLSYPNALIHFHNLLKLWAKPCVAPNPPGIMHLLLLFRNIALHKHEGYHSAMIDAAIPDSVLEFLRRDLYEGWAELCSAQVEFLLFLCTTTKGIQWMESVNAKKVLMDDVLQTSNAEQSSVVFAPSPEKTENSTFRNGTKSRKHTIYDDACHHSRNILIKQILPILDDIQDVVALHDKQDENVHDTKI